MLGGDREPRRQAGNGIRIVNIGNGNRFRKGIGPGMPCGVPPSSPRARRDARDLVVRVRQVVWSIRVPSTVRNCASHAGWAGQAGAVTKLPSVTASSMLIEAYVAPASSTSGAQAG